MSILRLPFCMFYIVLTLTGFAASGSANSQEGSPPRIEELIERLSEPELSKREKAQDEILKQWDKWTNADLEKLEKVGQSSDSEVASRAKEVRKSISQLRSFCVHLAVKLDKLGNLSLHGQVVLKSVDDPSMVTEAFKPYTKPPKDPTGKMIFTGLRIFFELEKDVPFEKMYQVLTAARKSTPLTEVILMNPQRTEESKSGEGEKLLLFTVRGKDDPEGILWKDKFLMEMDYHYQTQVTKSAEIEELNKTVESLKKRVSHLEQQLKDK